MSAAIKAPLKLQKTIVDSERKIGKPPEADKIKRTKGNTDGNTKSAETGKSEESGTGAKSELIRKFSLGGDAWNKKSTTRRKINSGLKTEIEAIDDEEDEGRGSVTDSPTDKDADVNPTDGGEGGDDSINVVVRVRPLNKNEIEKRDSSTVQFPGDGVLRVDNNGYEKIFTFNVLFEPEASQKDVFEHSGVKKLVAMAVDGYACTCFAFGQTGSGKTHSITGPPQKVDSKLEESDYGLIPRSFHNLLEVVSDGEKKGISYTLTASYFELYNEQILDLLNVQGGKKLNMRWSANKGFYIENLFTIQCENFDDLMAVLEEGLSNRSTSAHNMNDFSSRSHSMLTINIDSEQQDPTDESLYNTKHGKLTFVDLAGSEKVKYTNTSGDQLLETNNINKSLLVLGKCISALGDVKKKNGHIPYRDSKLTKLLADSIGGNGVTLMIACVSPSKSNQGETMNTLRYATRTKRIKNKPLVIMDPRERLIMNLKKEIKVLKSENQLLREHAHVPADSRAQNGEKTQGGDMDGVKDSSKATIDSFSVESTDLYAMLQEYMVENEALRGENSEFLMSRDRMKRDQQYIVRENDRLQAKVDDLQRFILAGEQPRKSIHSTRQNSWHDPHSGLNSASSGSTLRSYHSVPDVYYSSHNTGPYAAYPIHAPIVYKQNSMPGLPPVKHKTALPSMSPSELAYQNAFRHSFHSSPQQFKNPSPPLRNAQSGPIPPVNTYTQKFEVSKSLGARNAFQHSPNVHGRMISKQLVHGSNVQHNLPMKALPSPPGSLHNTMVLSSPSGLYGGNPTGSIPINQSYYPTSTNSGMNSPARNTQFDLNEQLKQELMMLEGEIRSTQGVLSTGTR